MFRFSLYYYSGLGDIARKEETLLIIDTRSFTGRGRRESFVDGGDSDEENEAHRGMGKTRRASESRRTRGQTSAHGRGGLDV